MQTTISTFSDQEDLSQLTEAEREVWIKVENGSHGPRSYARVTGRAPGTIGNLLARARAKLEGESA